MEHNYDDYEDYDIIMTNAVHPPMRGNGGYDWDKIIKTSHILTPVIYSLVFVLGTLGNGVVIWATGFRMKKTIDTVWFLNLAVADFLVTAAMPLKITDSALDYHWPFGRFICKMDAFVFYINMYASIYTVVLISVDRCVCLVFPVWTRTHRTVRNASWVSLGVWVLALALSIPALISTDLSSEGFCYEYEDHKIGVFIGVPTNFLVGFVVPFSIIVSCYSVIINRYRNNPSLIGQSSRSFKIMAAVIAALFLCWAPFHIIRLICMFAVMGLIDSIRPITANMYQIEDSATLLFVLLIFGRSITVTLALVNSCLNPLLYMFSLGFKDMFRSRSILKVLEKALDEEPPQINTPTDPDVTKETPC